MSCPHCPHCCGETKKGDPKKGGLLDLISESDQRSEIETPFLPKLGVRGKAREYSPAFEVAWRIYGRKEQKFEAYAMWVLRSKEVGGEQNLGSLFFAAMKWQAPRFSTDGWKFAPYLERYLKRRKWEDEPPAAIRPARAFIAGTDRKLMEWRAAAQRAATPEEIQRAREESGRVIRDLADRKAVR